MAVDRLVDRDGREAPCRTQSIPLGPTAEADDLPRTEGVPDAAYARLAQRYGGAAGDVLATLDEATGDLYLNMGPRAAQRLHGDAIKMAELQKNDDAWALAVTEKAYDQYLEGSPEKALKTFTELKDKLEHGLDVEDENLLPETLVSIARCYRNMGQMNAAVETYKLAQERYAKRQNKIGEVACADGIASTYSEFARRKEYEQQYAVVKNMLAEVPAALKSERDYRKLAALIAFNHAQHQLITEQYDGTVKSFTEAVAELNALNDMTTAPRAMCGLGMARLRSAQQAKNEGTAHLNEVSVVNDLKAAIENFKNKSNLGLFTAFKLGLW